MTRDACRLSNDDRLAIWRAVAAAALVTDRRDPRFAARLADAGYRSIGCSVDDLRDAEVAAVAEIVVCVTLDLDTGLEVPLAPGDRVEVLTRSHGVLPGRVAEVEPTMVLVDLGASHGVFRRYSVERCS